MSQTNKVKLCKSCNLEFAAQYQFCTKCGRKLSNKPRCSKCESALPTNKNTNFCPNCGNSLELKSNSNPKQSALHKLKFDKYRKISLKSATDFMTIRNQLIIGAVSLILLIIFIVNSGSANPPSIPNLGYSCYGGSVYKNYVSDYTSAWGRNQMRVFGLDVIDSQGNQLTVEDFSKSAYRALSTITASGSLSKSEINNSYQPGFGLYNFLNGVFSDPDIAYSVKEGMKCSAPY